MAHYAGRTLEMLLFHSLTTVTLAVLTPTQKFKWILGEFHKGAKPEMYWHPLQEGVGEGSRKTPCQLMLQKLRYGVVSSIR